MKKITLYSPGLSNDGSFVDAGTTLTIGDKPDEISADRAKERVDAGLAVSETAARADAKSAPEA